MAHSDSHLFRTEVIDRHLRRLRAFERYRPSAELDAIAGLLPPDLDAEQAYREHLFDTHREPQRQERCVGASARQPPPIASAR